MFVRLTGCPLERSILANREALNNLVVAAPKIDDCASEVSGALAQLDLAAMLKTDLQSIDVRSYSARQEGARLEWDDAAQRHYRELGQ